MIAVDPVQPRGIVWLASYPRSGNTWLGAFLSVLIGALAGAPESDDTINRRDHATGVESSMIRFYVEAQGAPAAAANPREIAGAGSAVQERLSASRPGIALINTHSFTGRVSNGPAINRLASAGAVYIVRNPLDLAISLAAHMAKTVDDAIAVMAAPDFHSRTSAGMVGETWSSWRNHVATWTLPADDAVHVVRYEDLLATPLDGFAAIAAHLRLGATPQQIAQAVELTSHDRLQAQGRRDGRSGQWRERLTMSQIDRILAVHGDQMRRFGYLPA